jgi:hypothetical protein
MRLKGQMDGVLHVEEPQTIEAVDHGGIVVEQHEAVVHAHVERHVLADTVGEVQVVPGARAVLGVQAVAIAGVGEAEVVARAPAVGIEVAVLAHESLAGGEQGNRLGVPRNEQGDDRGEREPPWREAKEATHQEPPGFDGLSVAGRLLPMATGWFLPEGPAVSTSAGAGHG